MAILLFKWFFLLGSCFRVAEGSPADPVKYYHPLYVSITEISHNASTNGLEISCKMFTDDFEKALLNTFNKRMDLINPADREEANQLVASYVKKHLVVRIEGKPVLLEFVGFERERDAIWSYFEVKQVNVVPKKIEVRNNLLYETYNTQINLMHVTVSGIRKSTKLNYPETDAKFEY